MSLLPSPFCRTGEELFTVYFSLPFIRKIHWGDEHLHKFTWSVITVPFLSFPRMYSWANVKISVEKQLIFTANFSCSVLREEQHSWQNNIPLGPDLNPRKAREAFPWFLVQEIIVLSISWTSYTLVKIGWTFRPRHHEKWKILSALLISFGQKVFEIRYRMFYCKETRKRKLGTITSTKKNRNFFSIQKPITYLLYIQQE